MAATHSTPRLKATNRTAFKKHWNLIGGPDAGVTLTEIPLIRVNDH
jgi:hypothetical protein